MAKEALRNASRRGACAEQMPASLIRATGAAATSIEVGVTNCCRAVYAGLGGRFSLGMAWRRERCDDLC